MAAGNDEDRDLRDRLLTIAEVESIVSIKKSAIYEWAAEGRFPKPIKIGGATRWSEREIYMWIEHAKALRK
jgi:prophage regulatory protein